MCSNPSLKIIIGECLGSFILVFFGCGASVISVIYNVGMGLFQIAMIWGMALTLAIYACRYLSCAHFNPALSVALFFMRRIRLRPLITYIIAQLAGAGLAALLLLFLFNDSIHAFEVHNNIVRGDANSVRTAMLLVNYFPNPAMPVAAVSTLSAFFAELLGTFFLIQLILLITDDCNVGKPNFSIAPFFIGCFLAILICVFAPITQASFNPARDLGPRIIAIIYGWKDVVFNSNIAGVLMVYVMGPLTGGLMAALSFFKFVKPLMSPARV